MTSEPTAAGLTAAIDALALVQGQLDGLERSLARIESTQREMLGRLDAIDTGQAAVTKLLSVLETILARSIEDQEATRAGFSRVAQIAAFAHAAARGHGAPLPIDTADDPLLEPYLLTQPADRTSTVRALVDWRKVASAASSAELVSVLTSQYRPSPTDSAKTRVLRYQLAAITRAELEGRGVAPSSPPASTRASDRSPDAMQARSAELARLWRSGESTALFADPELAGALDLFEAEERRRTRVPEEQLSVTLAELHRALGDRLEAGERPLASAEPGDDVTATLQPDRAR